MRNSQFNFSRTGFLLSSLNRACQSIVPYGSLTYQINRKPIKSLIANQMIYCKYIFLFGEGNSNWDVALDGTQNKLTPTRQSRIDRKRCAVQWAIERPFKCQLVPLSQFRYLNDVLLFVIVYLICIVTLLSGRDCQEQPVVCENTKFASMSLWFLKINEFRDHRHWTS